MAWRGVEGDQGIYTSVWDGTESWSDQRGPLAGAGSTGSPAFAVLNGRVYMFWKGIEGDRTVWWSVLDLVADPDPLNAIWSSQRQVTFDTIEGEGARARDRDHGWARRHRAPRQGSADMEGRQGRLPDLFQPV